MSRDNVLWALGGGVLAAAGLFLLGRFDPPRPAPAPPPAKPSPLKPAPDKDKKPKRPRCPSEQAGEPEPMVDLLAMPKALRPNNIASRGLGCCTFRSAEYAARWQGEPALYGLPEWMREQGIAGGGTPAKQAEMVRRISQARGMEPPPFVQYEGRDPSIIELALRTGRLPCITWQANHMLVCVHLDESRAAILDNNDPHRVQWFDRATFVRKWTQGGGGWVFVLLSPGPPPPPTNADRPVARGQACGKRECGCGCRDGDPCRCASAETRTKGAETRGEGAACSCSPDCTCGCQEGDPCRCGSCPLRPALDGLLRLPAELAAGVEWVFAGGERWTYCGDACSRSKVEAALEDDSGRPHLTLVGAPDARRAAVEGLGGWASACRVRGFDGFDDWALSCGFAPSQGAVTCYLQAPTGRVLYRGTGAGLAEALRRADPSYRPEADPDGGALSADGVRDWLGRHWHYLAAGALAVGGGWYLLSRSKGEGAAAPAPAQQQPAPQPSLADLAAILRDVRDRLPAPPTQTR